MKDSMPSPTAAEASSSAEAACSSAAASPSGACSSPPAAADHDPSKYARLHHLLDQTTLFAKFMADKLPARYAASTSQKAAAAPATAKEKASHLAERSASLAELLPQGSDLALQPFQVAGVDWLISLYENGLNGILADEMGLGKTIQVIMFLAHLRRHAVFGPYLIVAPLGTLPAWKDEFQRWTPDTNVLVYHGDKASRAEMRTTFLGATSTTPDASYPVVVTSYELAMRDVTFLKRVHWKLLVVDEGHRLKNMECLLLRTLKSFPSENRLLLTGTPLQNSLPELWSLLHFLLPDVFASLSQFQSWFDFEVADREGEQNVINAERDHLLVTKLHSILRPFVLRRVKSEVLTKLATKREYTIYTPMTPMQRLYYQAILDGTVSTLSANSASVNVRNVLMQLRKVVNHPYLLMDDQEEAKLGVDMELKAVARQSIVAADVAMSDAAAAAAVPIDDTPLVQIRRHLARQGSFVASDGDESSASESEEEEEYKDGGSRRDAASDASFETIPQRNKRRKFDQATVATAQALRRATSAPRPSLSFDRDPQRLTRVCGKLQFLDVLLPALRARDSRVLIFSQMTRVLDILEDFLVLHGAPAAFKYCRIDGNTSSADRARQIAAFNADASHSVFLLSTRAGGLGLNLAAADTVVLFDSDWSPQADEQAMDRAHRLTQKRKVLVLRLLTPGSVEVGMAARAASKKKLEHLVLTKGRFNDNAVSQNGASAAAVHWSQQQNIVSELVELFQMKSATHAAIRTQLDDTPHTDAPTAPTPPPAKRRTSLKRKSTSAPASSPPAAASSSAASSPAAFAFTDECLAGLLDRDAAPPADVIPRSSFEGGFEHVAQVVDRSGLLHMLTEHGNANDAPPPINAS